MQVGKQVVCINDTFTDQIRAIYHELPVKGVTYTIRETSLGREKLAHFKGGKIVPGGASEESVTVRLLLKELSNPPDPMHTGENELGFNAERFRELDETSESETKVESDELVHS
jgi:hypothetical protein